MQKNCCSLTLVTTICALWHTCVHAMYFRNPHSLFSQSVFDANVHALPSFDFYVLALSWQPEFCHHKEKQYPGCQHPEEYWTSHFTMHGLWPELTQGPHPGFCRGESFDAARIEKQIGFDTLVQYWPDVKIAKGTAAYPDFWKHEWTRHGTCSGLDQVSYFSHALDLLREGVIKTPSIIQENVGKNVTLSALRAAFGEEGMAALKCDRGATLSQVFTCWTKDGSNVPVAQESCPEHILKEGTCTASTIYIPAFSSE